MPGHFTISTDKSRLDLPFIHGFLTEEAYWAKGRSMEVVQKTIENSLCFGVYLDDRQVGFGRVVTDYAVFAWVMDVFVVEEHRKNGLSKQLMGAMLTHPDLKDVKRWGLATKDAHGLYEQYGFKPLKQPGFYMEKGGLEL